MKLHKIEIQFHQAGFLCRPNSRGVLCLCKMLMLYLW